MRITKYILLCIRRTHVYYIRYTVLCDRTTAACAAEKAGRKEKGYYIFYFEKKKQLRSAKTFLYNILVP